MHINRTLLRNTGLAVVALAFLAACDDNDNNDDVAENADPTGLQALGPDFARAFNQDPNDEPISLDGVTLNRTPQVEPFDL